MEQLIDSGALAKALCVTVTTVQRYTREKRIPFVVVGSLYRYQLSEVLSSLGVGGRLSMFGERGVPFGSEAYRLSVEKAKEWLAGLEVATHRWPTTSHRLKTLFEEDGQDYICNDAMADAVMSFPQTFWRVDSSCLETRFKVAK